MSPGKSVSDGSDGLARVTARRSRLTASAYLILPQVNIAEAT
jgi:hypothetical protein